KKKKKKSLHQVLRVGINAIYDSLVECYNVDQVIFVAYQTNELHLTNCFPFCKFDFIEKGDIRQQKKKKQKKQPLFSFLFLYMQAIPLLVLQKKVGTRFTVTKKKKKYNNYYAINKIEPHPLFFIALTFSEKILQKKKQQNNSKKTIKKTQSSNAKKKKKKKVLCSPTLNSRIPRFFSFSKGTTRNNEFKLKLEFELGLDLGFGLAIMKSLDGSFSQNKEKDELALFWPVFVDFLLGQRLSHIDFFFVSTMRNVLKKENFSLIKCVLSAICKCVKMQSVNTLFNQPMPISLTPVPLDCAHTYTHVYVCKYVLSHLNFKKKNKFRL
ncbi:hypothetical protein RFI_29735, partial [Reticulomyxa filosa]